jgi:tetratricopeptide (TPR) repeat protein
MAKVALLIGVSQYGAGLQPLVSPLKDVEAMRRVLHHPEMGGFTEIIPLLNPDPLVMEEAIETLFSGRQRDDLVLLFFSGHGIKDENGRLYFATCITRKDEAGTLIKATAVPVNFVQEVMTSSRSRRQVLILDCCFSGAFADGMRAKGGDAVDVRAQLGGEGRAVLTSSTSTQYSFEHDDDDLSAYTRYIVEGIETGAADIDSDGTVSVDELHEYASRKVREAAPAMKPEIYVVKQGYKIRLAQAPVGDLRLRYRKEVELFASRGEISSIGRSTLNVLRQKLGLSSDEAAVITADVLKPYQDYQRNLQRYEEELAAALQHEASLSAATKQELQRYQQVLGLRVEDVELIEAEVLSRQRAIASEGQQKRLAEDYAQALHAIRNGQWEEAIRGFEQVLEQQADYEQVVEQLQDAKRQHQLARLYSEAESAYEQQSWRVVIAKLKELVQIDPDYRDVSVKLESAKRAHDTSELYDEARRRYQAGQWQSVLTTLEQIQTLNPHYADPDQLRARAQRKLRQTASPSAASSSAAVPLPSNGRSPQDSNRSRSSGFNELIPFAVFISICWIALGLIGQGASRSLGLPEDTLKLLALLGALGGAIDGGMTWLAIQSPGQPSQVSLLIQSMLAGAVVGAVTWMAAEWLISEGMTNQYRAGGGALIGGLGGALIGTLVLYYFKQSTTSNRV